MANRISLTEHCYNESPTVTWSDVQWKTRPKGDHSLANLSVLQEQLSASVDIPVPFKGTTFADSLLVEREIYADYTCSFAKSTNPHKSRSSKWGQPL
jgi:hypothetical protein